MSQLVITQTKSLIGQTERARSIVKALGLGKINSQNTLKDNNCIRGMINKVNHLVQYEIKS
ncbi:MAG: 50S ribosomal protein L30 [Oligoflexales bacterium]|nr:50S ribosomal protein L30 [Oligoflexales bacterium]